MMSRCPSLRVHSLSGQKRPGQLGDARAPGHRLPATSQQHHRPSSNTAAAARRWQYPSTTIPASPPQQQHHTPAAACPQHHASSMPAGLQQLRTAADVRQAVTAVDGCAIVGAIAMLGCTAGPDSPVDIRPLVQQVVAAVDGGAMRQASSQEWCTMVGAVAALGCSVGPDSPVDIRPLKQRVVGAVQAGAMQGATSQAWCDLLLGLHSLGCRSGDVQPAPSLASAALAAKVQEGRASVQDVIDTLAALGSNGGYRAASELLQRLHAETQIMGNDRVDTTSLAAAVDTLPPAHAGRLVHALSLLLPHLKPRWPGRPPAQWLWNRTVANLEAKAQQGLLTDLHTLAVSLTAQCSRYSYSVQLFGAALVGMQTWVAASDRGAAQSAQGPHIASMLLACAQVLPGAEAAKGDLTGPDTTDELSAIGQLPQPNCSRHGTW